MKRLSQVTMNDDGLCRFLTVNMTINLRKPANCKRKYLWISQNYGKFHWIYQCAENTTVFVKAATLKYMSGGMVFSCINTPPANTFISTSSDSATDQRRLLGSSLDVSRRLVLLQRNVMFSSFVAVPAN